MSALLARVSAYAAVHRTTSLLVGWFLAMRLAVQDGISQQIAGTIYMWTAVWSIIGSRLLWWVTTPNISVWEIPMISSGPMRMVTET